MEDGTLHRFQASSTILATGVIFLFFASHIGDVIDESLMNTKTVLCVSCRVMVEHTFLQPQHIPALEMAMPWWHVLGSHFRYD